MLLLSVLLWKFHSNARKSRMTYPCDRLKPGTFRYTHFVFLCSGKWPSNKERSYHQWPEFIITQGLFSAVYTMSYLSQSSW